MTRRSTASRIKRGTVEWINVEHARSVDIRAIAQEFNLSSEHMRLVKTASHRSRLFVAPKYVLMLITHPVYDKAHDDVVIHELDVILTAKKIVTVHHGQTAHVSELFSEVKSKRTHAAMKHPAVVLAHILTALTMDVYNMLETLGRRVDSIEDRVYERNTGLLQEIVSAQTNIIDVQKTLESRASMIERLLSTASTTAKRHLNPAYEQLMHHTAEVHDSLEIEYRTAETLHRAHETYLNARTNRLINMLTAVTIIVMPATLMAGIFGMNTSHPWILGMQYDFAIIISIMALGGLTLWFLIRHLR